MNKPVKNHGGIATGHRATTNAAACMLEAGGNAWDAALAAMATACVAEPVLASPGGGGFLLAQGPGIGGEPVLYDFFVQTPQQARRLDDTEFFPVLADFGTAQQEFHIGTGTVAVPGMMPGIAAIHADLASMPLADILHPAMTLAREGVEINDFQAYLFRVVSEIYTRTPESLTTYGTTDNTTGGSLKNPALANTFEGFSREGVRLFSEGDVAEKITELCTNHGGHLSLEDLGSYEVIRRTPLSVDYGPARLFTNPPPSTGGVLISFALRLLQDLKAGGPVSAPELVQVMAATNQARVDSGLNTLASGSFQSLLDEDLLRHYRESIAEQPKAHRGTTHISIVDAQGNLASVTLSNGEGCGHMVPGTGFMLNNMLGEEDINPSGFHGWPPDTRLSSMMAPGFLTCGNGDVIALGSGGSNRIRTALLQVINNMVTGTMSLQEAIHAPRLHYENDHLHMEALSHEQAQEQKQEREALLDAWPGATVWPEPNMYFGGVHAVRLSQNGKIDAVGDPRRGGAARVV